MPASFVIDMDGVVYHGHQLIPGAAEFVERLRSGGHKFLFLTNNSQWTPRDLRHRLGNIGIDVEESAFHTSALATAEFLKQQMPGGTAYVIGGAGRGHREGDQRQGEQGATHGGCSSRGGSGTIGTA